MLFRKSLENPILMLRVGMSFLAAGSLSLHYLARVRGVTPDLADGVAGFCYGIAIGTLLLSIRARHRRRERPQ